MVQALQTDLPKSPCGDIEQQEIALSVCLGKETAAFRITQGIHCLGEMAVEPRINAELAPGMCIPNLHRPEPAAGSRAAISYQSGSIRRQAAPIGWPVDRYDATRLRQDLSMEGNAQG
jgi:hypothetical protein